MNESNYNLHITKKSGITYQINNANVKYDEDMQIIGQGFKLSIDIPEWTGEIAEIIVSKGKCEFEREVLRVTFD